MLCSFFLIRAVHGVKRALLETIELGSIILTLFGLGILALAPAWWTRQVTDFVPYELKTVTNEEVTLSSLLAFLITHFARKRYFGLNSDHAKPSKGLRRLQTDVTPFVSSTHKSGSEMITVAAGKSRRISLLALALIAFGFAMVLYAAFEPVGTVAIICTVVSTYAGTGFVQYHCSPPSAQSTMLFQAGMGSILAGLCIGLIAFHRLFRDDPNIVELAEEETEIQQSG